MVEIIGYLYRKNLLETYTSLLGLQRILKSGIH